MGRNWKQHQRRYRYRKMDPVEFQAALAHLAMTVAEFSYVTGAREDRVERWKRGEEDIPTYVPMFCAGMTIAEAAEIMFRTADHYYEEGEAS